jgi:hypothetical protein
VFDGVFYLSFQSSVAPTNSFLPKQYSGFMSASANSYWKLASSIAHLDSGVLHATLDVSRPQVGLHQKSFDYGHVPCCVFMLHRAGESEWIGLSGEELDKKRWPLSVADAYVRGGDLVASYTPTNDWPYAPQVYWSANTLESIDGVVGSVSQLVSVQTPLLDTHPKIDLLSQVPSSEYLLLSLSNYEAEFEPIEGDRTLRSVGGTMCVLWRLLAAPLSYVEIVEATDFYELSCGPAGDGRLLAAWRLFAEFLEKGVIRKARVHGAFIDRAHDCEIAIECCRAIERSPLPLTT